MKIFGIMGYKNTGKTGLMERLVTDITHRGLRVSTIKHAHHTFDIDQQGKDSFRHRTAGAHQVLLASRDRWALMTELRGAGEPTLDELVAQLAPVDLVLVEGFKSGPHPKIETWRAVTGTALLAPSDPSVLAVASDTLVTLDRPVFDLDDTSAIADFILAQVGL
jgi:molybdopterin-guanine dinucleotide biosynthesis adapter protein